MDKTILYNYSVFSRLTQLGECNLYAVEAVGSSPTVRIALE